MVVDAAFYLVFIGAAAVITGFISLAVAGMAPWVQWLVFATIAAAAMVFFRAQLYTKLRSVKTEFISGPAGERITLDAALPAGGRARQQFHGSTWNIENSSDVALEQGSKVRIDRVDGTTLVVSSTQK
jgi:membrane protein implicated in regulation of membrane protease activity